MHLYTRTGDQGQTHLIGGRTDKDDTRVEAYGTVDELNSFVGAAMAELNEKIFSDLLADLEKIQHELFDCGSDLANVTSQIETKLNEETIQYLEERIDALTEEAPKLQRFILPGGTKGAAALHIARTVCRRTERIVVSLAKREEEERSPRLKLPLKYLNRLSDYFFAAARIVNARLHVPDIEYERSGKVFNLGKREEET